MKKLGLKVLPSQKALSTALKICSGFIALACSKKLCLDIHQEAAYKQKRLVKRDSFEGGATSVGELVGHSFSMFLAF